MASPSYRVALVTGASRGIGAAICRRLAAMGLEVHALARDGAALDALARETGARPHSLDVRDTDGIAAVVAGLDIDVLVNNAGMVSAVKPLAGQSGEDIDRVLDVNLRAPLQIMRLVLPGMIARGRGHIVNLTSTAAHHTFAGTAPYAAAKAGLSQAGRVTRYDLAGTGVRLTEIAPGRVETEIYLEAFGDDRSRLQDALYAKVRALMPEDVAEAVAMALKLPNHADASLIELSPTDQATGGHIFPSKAS